MPNARAARQQPAVGEGTKARGDRLTSATLPPLPCVIPGDARVAGEYREHMVTVARREPHLEAVRARVKCAVSTVSEKTSRLKNCPLS